MIRIITSQSYQMTMETLTTATIQKYAKKSVSQLIKIAERHFNRFIRDRDLEGDHFQCISCGQWHHRSQMNASHFMAAGLYSATRFDEMNVHGGCIRCNKYLHGNLGEYRKRLVEKIGEDKVKMIEMRARMSKKQDRWSLIAIIEKYKK